MTPDSTLRLYLQRIGGEMILTSKPCFVIVLIVGLLAPLYGFAQIDWWHSMGSPGSAEKAEQHAVHNGDIYVCGYFEETIVLGDITLTSRGESDIFLYKARTDGTILWAKSLGGSSYDGDVGLSVDHEGNVYMAGGFIDKLYLDNSVILTAGNSYWNSFFSKFDENGNLTWIKGMLGASQNSEARVWGNISVNSNSLVVATTFSGSISVDGLLIPGSTFDSYLLIAKFDLEGNLIWKKLPDGASACSKIYLDETGICYLAGPFAGNITFDNRSLTGNRNYSDVFLAKLDSQGTTLWLKGGIKTTSRIDNNSSRSFTVDPAGNVYVIGLFKGDVAFDAITLHGNTDEDYSIVDTFIVKYNAAGDVMHAANFGDAYGAWGSDIVHSSFGLYILGMTPGSGQFFYCRVSDNLLDDPPPVYVNAFGIPWRLSVVGENSFYISGSTARVESQTARGGWDGVLIKVGACIAQLPDAVSAINGAALLCVGDEVTYSVDRVENADHFLWEVPPIFSPNGAMRTLENEISLKVISTGIANISVSANNECGQSKSTSDLVARASVVLELPVITKDSCDHALSIPAGENIEWLRNDELIAGANSTKLTVLDPGFYKVRIHNSCSYSESAEVFVTPVVEGYEPFFPNVITPNHDEKNDSFSLDTSLLQSSLQIFNRWGELVYESNAYENSWQGEDVSSGVYFYYVENSCHPKPYRGTVPVLTVLMAKKKAA